MVAMCFPADTVITGSTPPGVAPIPSVEFSTAGLPARQQFEAYRADGLGFAELIQPEPGAACPADYTAWSLGPVVLKRTNAPALDKRRTPAMIRRDGLDLWLLSLPGRNDMAVEAGGRRMTVSAARPVLLSAEQPYAMACKGEDRDRITLFVSRDALPGLGLPKGRDGCQVLETPMGRLLVEHVRQMAAGLPGRPASDAPALCASTLALLRATLAPSPEHEAAARPQAEAVQRRRLRRMIRERLAAATLTPERLSRAAGISRSTLYRLFEPLGGVAAAIQAERLAEARRLLEDPREHRGIRAIAEAVGFFDASVFSRAFRRAHGASPGEVREAALAGRPLVLRAPGPAPRGFLDMLARV
jgi:AraC-like DNA-binding protein